MKKKVLIMAGYYLPSIKGGGPIQSIKNLVDNLSEKIDFYIVAADRDLGDDQPFFEIEVDEWLQIGKAKVWYTNYSKLTWKKTEEIIDSIDYDLLYLNSFFSYKDSIVPVLLSKFKRISKKPILIAPRGQFSSGALGLKNRKKKLYIKTTKLIGLYKDVIWHATAEMEKKDIISIFGNRVNIKIANNLTANYKELRYEKNIEKVKGELKIVFISRIHPKKNLNMAIELLKNAHGNVEFNIYGPIEDKLYWLECKKLIKDLPKNIIVSYRGSVEQNKIIDIFKAHHIFLFPTLGENFGHVISEALIGGCPIIISDQTPWGNLEKQQVGWDIGLADIDKFNKAIDYCINLDGERYNELSKNAFTYGIKKSNKLEDIEESINLFK